jgi:hypothetical protein
VVLRSEVVWRAEDVVESAVAGVAAAAAVDETWVAEDGMAETAEGMCEELEVEILVLAGLVVDDAAAAAAAEENKPETVVPRRGGQETAGAVAVVLAASAS